MCSESLIRILIRSKNLGVENNSLFIHINIRIKEMSNNFIYKSIKSSFYFLLIKKVTGL